MPPTIQDALKKTLTKRNSSHISWDIRTKINRKSSSRRNRNTSDSKYNLKLALNQSYDRLKKI